MRRLNERNKSYVYFMNCKGKTQGVDSDGLYTGENLPTYGDLTEARMVVGIVTGVASLKEFGITDDYSVKAVTDETDCSLSEASVVWLGFGKIEEYDEDTYVAGTPCIKEGEIKKYNLTTADWEVVNYTHVVTRVAKSFGYITYLLKAVDFDFYAQPPEPIVSA